ncbi:MAG TPA: ABC transporter permease [Candidatus Saccharimonadales bacterium]|jgi:ABC-2 type transport system permease protein|nr:ABC transporter permease [Candidatus Saccharimonadales bacterium]
MKHYLALIAIDLKLALRQRTVIFFNYLFPLMIFFGYTQLRGGTRSSDVMPYILTLSLAFGVLGSGLFGAGIRAIQEREMNILRRYKVTPITPVPLLAASMVTGFSVFMPYVILVFSLAHYLYHMPWPVHTVALMVFIAMGLVAFRAIGMVIASVANSMQEGTIIVQLFYFPMLFLSGATVPIESLPRTIRAISHFIPASYLVQGIKTMMEQGAGLAENWKNLGVMLITIIVGTAVSTKLFRWEKEEKIGGRAKLWIAAILLPFVALGFWDLFRPQ